MIRLALVLTRTGGWPRMLLLAGCTAVVSALLLVVVALLRLPANPDELLFDLVASPGTRGGTAFAGVLLTVPPLLLLYQAVRLGTAARERRLAALRLAGATPAEVRRLGAVEVGVPALAGSTAGVGLFALLRLVLGGRPPSGPPGTLWMEPATGLGVPTVALVPTSVAPTWWQLVLVVVGVASAGVAVGLLASRRVVVSPLGVTRRQAPPPPRPWGLLALLAVVVLAVVALPLGVAPTLVAIVMVALAVVGVLGLTSWTAYRVGRYAETRAGSAAMLLAARRLVAEPRPVGRAAAAVGAIAMVGGGAGAVLADLVAMHSHPGQGSVDPFYLVSLGLLGVALLVSLLVAAGTLAVHSVESLLDRKRSMAALAAMGASVRDLERSQRFEAMLVALPMGLAGALLGALPLGGLVEVSAVGAVVLALTVVLTLGLVWAAIALATRGTRPWLRRAMSAANLRTE